ncbi:beta-lactamase/transpeptidase-like protein [Mycena capillaripes]|nr:beta-lactamase/transpeptidase-like protein [Mycena capillaripes]
MVSLSQQQQDAIRGLMSRAVESNSLPALFFGVSDENGEFFMHQEGRKILGDPSSDPLDENTIFWICSQTKLITSIAAMQLIEQGKIQLSTTVSGILPALSNPVIVTARDTDGKPTATTPAKNPITLGQLLNHTSGLDYNQIAGSYGSRPYGKDEDSSTWFKLMKVLSLLIIHNLVHQHANRALFLVFLSSLNQGQTAIAYGYSTDCVGFIVERISGKSLDQYFKDHIFSPLGITSASFYLTPDLKERLLPLSIRDAENNLVRWNHQVEIINQDPETTNVHFGGVGVYMSLKDYLSILGHLLQIKAGKATNPILRAASVAALFEPTLDTTAANSLAKFLGMPEGSAQFSTGLMLAAADRPRRRKKGTGSWGGWASTSHFVDTATGIAGVFGTQLVPSSEFDPAYETLWFKIEEALYAGLQK